ncbi:MAG: acetate/propionate family kinase, partial [Thermomicrobiales bacterium]
MILIVNAGSSSLKVALYRQHPELEIVISASVDRLDDRGGQWVISVGDQSGPETASTTVATYADALAELMTWLDQHGYRDELEAVGHRVVHGGTVFSAPVLIDPAVMCQLTKLIPMAPTHLPQTIACIEAMQHLAPPLPHVACFDTAFHTTMPLVARRYPLPRSLADQGIRRYGFHGLSYESIQWQLDAIDHDARSKRTIIAHLGNGASMVALRDGQSIDTTMGFTPAGGLMMGTRTGDLDPGLLVFLMQSSGLDASALDKLINKESGLLGVSGISGDVRDLESAAPDTEQAREAIVLYCYIAKKQLGSMIAALGELHRLVFTGGIGEHSAMIRAGICEDLAFFGIELDPERNAAHQTVISPDTSSVEIMV